MTNVIGLYDDPRKAQDVKQELLRAGLQEDDIELMDQKEDRQLDQHLAEFGLSREHARLYAEAVRRGKAVLNAHAPDDQADQILEILNNAGARDIEEAKSEFSAGGGKQGSLQSIPEVEEKVSVGKKQTLLGGKRVTTKVTEKPIEESVRLKEEKVEIRKSESDRKLSPEEAEQAFKEETRDFTETREVAEVTKEARETGRVEIETKAEEREEKVQAKVRKTEVKTEDIKPEEAKKKQ